jgi:hypothetical protein
MLSLICQTYLLLLRFELPLYRGDLRSIHDTVRARATRPLAKQQPPSLATKLCHAVDLACVFYPKRVLCLQRSATTVLLLRHCGVDAELVIGAQILPYRSHAWVERDGIVLNDKPYMREIYRVLEQC